MASIHLPGVVGDRYEIRRPIGAGGMADVYLATDRSLDRDVAIKVLNRERAADPAFVERFRREAKAAAGLSHSHVVAIFDWGELDDTYYLVMEYAPGGDLGRLLARRGALPEAEVLSLGAQAASALDEAHRHGIVHRDVKPGNILLDANGDAKVADFGIARALGAGRLTETATILGSAHYLSPEQARGEPIDGRSDVYSLGVVLYELLAGKPPFDGDSPIAVALRHIGDPPPSLRQVRPSLSPMTERIVLKALAKEPAERFQTAAQMRDALEDARRRLEWSRVATTTMDVPPSKLGPTADRSPVDPPVAVAAAIVAPAREPHAKKSRGPTSIVVLALLALALTALVAGFLAAGALERRLGPETTSAPTVAPSPLPGLASAPPTLVTATAEPAVVATPSASPASAHIPTPVPALPSGATPSTLSAAVAVTPTATPQIASATQAATAPPPALAPPAPTTQPPASNANGPDPAQTVVRFYDLVGSHEFARAAMLWSARMRAANPPAESITKRFAQTQQIVVRQATVTSRDDVAGTAVVAVDLFEVEAGAPSREIAGSWQLVRGPSGWLMDQPNLRYV